ncbi:MAG: tRNA (adenosine(37)-N6)-dimethylallyltransferase MiaA [Bacteroidetes bacterium]|nr:tRNA (adenosine(37)-N6)-dimethylallyltransferase MiaA [Bacteroidota bacterium]
MEKNSTTLVTVLGPTAAGKTAFAAHMARSLDGEIISADSRQVYRGMDIGTGKDYDDYLVNGKRMPAHLIDILDAGYEYNVYLFRQDFQRVYQEITERGKIPLLCGGSGLYIESVLKNYKLLHVPPDKSLRADLEEKDLKELEGMLKLYGPLHNQTDITSKKRIIRAIEIAMHQSTRLEPLVEEKELNPIVFGIGLERSVRRKRITERLMKRLDDGLTKEVEGLIAGGLTHEKLDYYGLEYRYISRYIRKELNYDEMVRRLNSAIHQFAKRQMTYFRGMERRGIMIHWIDGLKPVEEMTEEAMSICRTELKAT